MTPSTMRLSPFLAALLLIGCADLALEYDRVPTELEILPRGGLIKQDEPVQLELVVRDQNGEEMPVPSWAPVEWGATEESVVELDGNGLLSPGRVGKRPSTCRWPDWWTRCDFASTRARWSCPHR